MIGVLFAGSTILTPLYVMYEHALGFSRLTLTLIYAVYVVGNLAALFLFGRLSDRVGRRRAAVPSLALAGISALVFMLGQGVVSLYIGRVLGGLAVGIGAGTGTAWLAELIADEDKRRAGSLATATNFLGLGVGALVAGLLAEYAPWPLHLTFVVYIAVLLVIVPLIWRTRETVTPAKEEKGCPRPRLSVAQQIRSQFVAPAVSGFAAMALTGFYAALAPSILAGNLHEPSHAVAGLLFFGLSMVVSGTILLTRNVASRAAMLWALGLLPPSVAAMVAAQLTASMPVMLMATALCGVAVGLGYCGSLQVVNQIAPAAQRAEVVSSYFVCCFAGNALPVIGVGVLSVLAGAATASIVFAVVIALFAIAALAFGIKYAR
jgi:predicted MFS family arabinose efflux permease